MSNVRDVRELRGRNMIDRDGDKIGTVDEIYLDRQTGNPEWALVSTGLLGRKSQFVPLRGAEPAGDDLRVVYSKDQVKDAPGIEADGELSTEEERRLYEHYGFEYAAATPRSEGVTTERPHDVTADRTTRGDRDVTGDDAMTRSEEELHVGTTERDRGQARLRKWVETEDVEETVPVRRETARVEREPITDDNIDAAMRGPDITESEHEVTLTEEEPVVEKRTVPKERMRLEKDVETDEERVGDRVRRERVEVEDDR